MKEGSDVTLSSRPLRKGFKTGRLEGERLVRGLMGSSRKHIVRVRAVHTAAVGTEVTGGIRGVFEPESAGFAEQKKRRREE